MTCSNRPSKVTVGFGPQPAEELDLLLTPDAAVGEVLAERLVLDGVPPDADAEAEPAFGEEVDLRRLLGDQGGLALREDDDPGHDLELREGGDEAEQHERLVERRVHVVGPRPSLVDRRVGAEHVVIGEEVPVAERLDALGVGAHGAGVAAQLGLREDDADLHGHGLPGRAGVAL